MTIKWFGNNGKITEKELVKTLSEYGTLSEEGEETIFEKTLITNDKKYEIKVFDIWNGKIAEEEIDFDNIDIERTPKNSDKYGWKVKKYNIKTNEFTSGIWRLLYQDDEYAYLITDESFGTYKYPMKQETTTEPYEPSVLAKKLNPTAKELFDKKIDSKSYRAVNELLDPSLWSEFASYDASFAVATPTLDLIIKSYQAWSGRLVPTVIKRWNGVRMDATPGDFKDTLEGSHGIYTMTGDSNAWLATVHYAGTLHLDLLGTEDADPSNASYKIRPIVIISTEIFDKKYATEDSLVNE